MKKNTIIMSIILLPILVFSQEAEYYSSSFLQEGSIVYSADKAFDGLLTTAWSEGVSDIGLNEWLEVDFSNSQHLHGIIIYPGFQKKRDLFYQNGVPSRISIYINDEFLDTYNLRIIKDSLIDKEYYEPGKTIPSDHIMNYSARIIFFENPLTVDTLRIVIDEIIPGAKWEDTLISEIGLITDDYSGNLKSQIEALKSIRDKDFNSFEKQYNITTLNPKNQINDYIHESSFIRPIENEIIANEIEGNSIIKNYFHNFYNLYINTTLIGININSEQYIIGGKSFHYGASEWMEGFPITIINDMNKQISFDEKYSVGGVPKIHTEFPEELIQFRPLWE